MQEIQEFKAAAAEFTEAAKRLGNVSSTSGIHFHGSAGLSLLSIAAICAAIMALGIGSAWYHANMRDLEELKKEVARLNAYRQVQSDKINKLEAEYAQLPER